MAFNPIIMSNFKPKHRQYTPELKEIEKNEKAVAEQIINTRIGIDSLVNSDSVPSRDYNFRSYNIGRSDYGIENIVSNVNKYIDILENGGSIHALDLETFGSYGDKATDLEKRLFGISEVGIVDKVIEGGKVRYNQNTLVFGISDNQVGAYETLIKKAKDDWKSLTSTERSVLERLSRYSGDFNDRFKMNPKGRYTLNSLADSRGKDFVAIEQGFKNMVNLGVNKGQGFYSDIAKEEMMKVANKINSIDSNERAIFNTFNGSNFDINVFNHALERIGSNQKIVVNNHLDTRTAISMAYPGELIDVQHKLASVYGVDEKITKEFGRLETFAKATGEEMTAHMAHQDAKFTMDLADKVVDRDSNLSLIYDVRNRLMTTVGNAGNNITSNKSAQGSVLFTRNALHLQGADYVQAYDVATNSYNEMNHYTDWGVRRDHFYNISDYKYLTPEQSAGFAGTKDLDVSNGLYVLQLEDAASDKFNKSKVTIVRSSEEEIKSLFQKNLEVFELVDGTRQASTTKFVTQDIINKTTAMAAKDSARRKFEGMFQLSGSGYFEANRMYSSYNSLNATANEMFGRSLTKQEAYELVVNNSLTIDNKTIKAGDVLGNLTADGKVKSSVGESFVELYDYLGDTTDVMTPVIDTIGAKIPESVQGSSTYAKVLRTKALQASYQEIANQIATGNAIDPKALGKSIAEAGFRDGSYLELGGITDDILNIDISSQSSAASGLFRAANINKRAGSTALKIEVEQEQIRNLKGISKKLIDRGILEQDYVDELFENAKDPWHIAQSLGSKVVGADASLLKIDDEPRFRTNIDNFKVDGKSFSQLATGIDVQSIVESKVNDVLGYKYTGHAGYILDNKKAGFGPDVTEMLMKKYNYSERNVKNLADGLYNHEYGLVNAEGLSAILFEDAEKNTLHLALTNEADVTSVFEDIMSGKRPTNAAVADLAVVREILGTKVAKIGNAEKGITTSFNVFMDKKDRGVSPEEVPWHSRLRIKEQDTIDESVRSLVKTHFDLPGLIESRDFRRAESYVNNTLMAPILDSAGLSGNENVNGVRKLVPNLADMMVEDMYNGDLLVNFLPAVYEEDKHVRASMDKMFGTEHQSASQMMERWSKDIQNGNLHSINDLGLEQKQWVLINMLEKKLGPNGKDYTLAQSILNLKGQSMFGDEYKVLEDYLAKAPSFLVKDEKIGNMWSTTSNAFEYISFGFMNDLSRPVGRQSLAFHNINMNEISNKIVNGASVLDNLNSYGINVGQTIVTDKFASRYLDRVKGEYESGLVGNVKIMNSEDVIKSLDNFDVEAFAKANNYDIADVQKTLNEYRAIGSTYQQHIMANPILRQQLWTDPEVQSVKFTKGADFKWAENMGVGSNIELNSQGFAVLGHEYDANGNRKAITYAGPAGKITSLDGNKISVVPDAAKIDDLKVIIAGVEKGVASVANMDADRAKLTQDMWNEIFGKETTLIGNFEAMKHESSSLIYGNYFNRIVDKAKTSKAEQDALAEMLNGQEGMNLGAKWIDNRLVISSNPADTKDFHEKLNQVIDKYRGREGYEKVFDDDNTLRAVINRAQMTEQRSSQGGFDDWHGKGLKVTNRLTQVVGAGETEDFWTESRKGGMERKIQPVIDAWMDEIQQEYRYENGVKRITEYGRAKQDIANMTTATMAIDGKEYQARTVEKTLDDLGFLKNGINASELSDSIFAVDSEGNGLADLYKIKLDEDMSVINPLTNKVVNEVYLPHLNSHYVGDQVMLTGAQKSTADFLTSLMRLKEGKLRGKQTSLGELQNEVNSMYAKMVASYSDDFTNKDGVLREMLLSGRLTYSGQGLAGTIIDPLVEKDADGNITGLRNKIFGDDVIKKGADGKTLFYDEAYTSRSMLEDMGINFETIGKQLEEEVYRNDTSFIDKLKKQGIVDENGKPIVAAVQEPKYVTPELTPLERQYFDQIEPQKPEFERADLEQFDNSKFPGQKPERPNVKLEEPKLTPMPSRPIKPRVEADSQMMEQYQKALADWEFKYESTELGEDSKLLQIYKSNKQAKLDVHADLQRKLLDYEDARKQYFQDKDAFYNDKKIRNDETFAKNQALIDENISNYKAKKQAYYDAKDQFFKDLKAHNDAEDLRLSSLYEQNKQARNAAQEVNDKLFREYSDNVDKAVRETYEAIGLMWAKERGFNGVMTRFPTFHPGSTLATKIKLSDFVHGQRIHTHSWSGMKLNADIDADNLSLWINLDKNGRLKASGDATEKALDDVRLAQAKNNREAFEAAQDEYATVAGQSFTKEGYREHLAKALMKEKGVDPELLADKVEKKKWFGLLDERSHYLQNPLKRQIAYVSRHGKEAIGYVSTPNYHLRDIASSQLLQNTDGEGIKKLAAITDLTTRTEQKLIDTKHLKEFQYTQAQKYKEALGMIASGDVTGRNQESGFALLRDVLDKARIYDKDEAKNIAKIDEVMPGLRDAFTTVFSNQEAVEQWNSPLRKSMAGRGVKQKIESLKNMIFDTDKHMGTDITNDVGNAIKRGKNTNKIVMNDSILDEGQRVASMGSHAPMGIYEFQGINQGEVSGQVFATLKNIDSNDTHRVYGNSLNEVEELLNLHTTRVSDAMTGVQRDIMVNTKADDVVNTAKQNAYDFERSKVASSYASQLSANPNADKIKLMDSVLKDSSIDTPEYRNHLQNLSPVEIDAFNRTKAYFDSAEAGDTRNFLRTVEALKQDGQIVESQGASLIEQFNNQIREKGANRKRIADDLIVNTMQPGGNSSAYLEHYKNLAKDIAPQAQHQRGPSINALVNKVNENQLYDLNKIGQDLVDNSSKYTSQITEMDKEMLGGSERIEKMIGRKAVEVPINKIRNTEALKLNNLQALHSQIANMGTDEARNYLNWNEVTTSGNEALEQLRSSKIAYGSHVGQEIGNLSMDELNKVYNMQASEEASEAVRNAIEGTRERLSQYFNALDTTEGSMHIISPSKYKQVPLSRVLTENGIELSDNLHDMLMGINTAPKMNMKKTRLIDDAMEGIQKAAHIDGGTMKTVAIGAALGLAGLALAGAVTNPGPLQPERRASGGGGGAPRIDGTYDKQQPAPPPQVSIPTARVEDPTGVKFSIKGKGNIDQQKVADAVSSTINNHSGTAMNVNVNTRDDSRGVDDNWLSDQFARLLGR